MIVDLQATIDGKALKAALAAINRVRAKRSPLPIVANMVRLDTARDMLTITATNLDQLMQYDVPATIETDGHVCVDYAALLDVTSGKDAVSIAVNGACELSAGGITRKAEHADVDNYVTMPNPETFDSIATFDAATLRGTLERAYRAVCMEDTRPVLGAVYVEFSDDSATFVATDGFRLFRETIAAAVRETNRVFKIPREAVKVLAQTLKEGTVTFSASTSGNQASFIAPLFMLVTRLVEGTYPNYRHILPRDFTATIHLDPAQLQDLCKRGLAALKAINSTRGKHEKMAAGLIRLDLATDGTLGASYLASENKPDYRSGKDLEQEWVTVPLDYLTVSHQGRATMLHLNPEYVADAIASHGQVVELRLQGPNKSLDINGQWVVMPIHLNNPR